MPQLISSNFIRRALAPLAAGALAFAILATAAPALAAEPTAADVETALQLYKDGKALRESGDADAALEKLRAAFALVETPIIAVELAKTFVAKGKLVEAREVLLTVPRIPVRKNESQRAEEARTEAETLAAQLKPKLAMLTVQIKGAGPDAQPKLSVDGVSVPGDAARVPRVVNPGAHVIVVEAYGRTTTADVSLSEGESRSIEVVAPEKPASAAGPTGLGPKPEGGASTPAPSSNGTRTALVYGGFGTAVVGIGVGTITGLMTLSKAGSLKDACSSDGRCPPSSRSDVDSVGTTATISTVGFAVGALGLAVGAAGLIFFRDVTPTASANGAGLGGRF